MTRSGGGADHEKFFRLGGGEGGGKTEEGKAGGKERSLHGGGMWGGFREMRLGRAVQLARARVMSLLFWQPQTVDSTSSEAWSARGSVFRLIFCGTAAGAALR